MKALSLAMPAGPFITGVTTRSLLLLSAGCLACLGLVMVASASMGVAESLYGNPFHFFFRHLVYLVLGMCVAVGAYHVPLSVWQKWSGLLLLLAFFLLIIVLIPGIGKRINGSMRWIGVGPLTLQPSEIAKFAMVAYISAYLVRRQEEVRSSFSGFLKPMSVVGLCVFLLLLEPDFGASMVIVLAVLGMLFLAGTPLLKFGGLILFVGVMGVLAIVMEPYRLKRLMSFTDPWADQFNSGYQLAQSLIAFGRGEWLGVGLGRSVQKLFYLPEAHTDFVFAVYAEEFGLIGVLLVLALFCVLVRSGMKIGQQAEQGGKFFAAYMAYGLSCLIGIQALVNMGVNMGLFPTKGLTLPLVSFGGTSLLVVFGMLAVLLRIDSENSAKAPVMRGRT